MTHDNRLKIIVGVDYGTAYTRVSYVTSDKTDVTSINVISDWPRSYIGRFKVPTRISYGFKNPPRNLAVRSQNLESKRYWGYGTKLLLDKSAETESYDDPSLRKEGASLFRLPPGRDARQITKEIFNVTPIECYFTMPAIWSDSAQTATREAAKAVGFGPRSADTIWMIREPEAAAIATLKRDLRPNSVNPGDNIMVLDCGGGTVVRYYDVLNKTYHRIEFDELCVGAGGKCGSTYIDRSFHQLMVEWFPESFEKIPVRSKGPGSTLINSFDQDIRKLLDSVVEAVLALVSEWIRLARDRKGKYANLIILVGGFGDSFHLSRVLQKWCEANGRVKLIRPPQWGLEGTVPSKLICRRHYGFVWAYLFRPGIDDERYWYIEDFHEIKYCSGRMDWKIEKGTGTTTATYRTVDVFYWWSPGDSYTFGTDLYSCNLDTAPSHIEHLGVVKIGAMKVDFSGIDISKCQWKNTAKGIKYKLDCIYRIDFRSQGALSVSCAIAGKTIGTATIDFSN
ncbi:hypothetical protein AOQ84DRAFT_397591 [Glonium stellatum]|uniref:Actin-like ATPase domain-containing protein n=1 Tax=Glonium stellatum TaxID=574774 RepID=A0A8E2F328_9PEZI|nr:hypothetical protein AOQ84DRAFT_397591 [Glonium stellatum]